MAGARGDLSVTALYTSQVWAWGGLSCAELLATKDARRVFDATNAALAAARMLNRGLAELRISLLHRHTMIDRLVADSGYLRVIELAAGLSRRGAAVSADRTIEYVEIDLPQVIAKKRELLERSEQGRNVLLRANLELVAGDVETVVLETYARPGEPVLVIAEGLLMYLAGDARRALFAKVRRLADLTGELRFIFDLVPTSEEPAPGAIGKLLEAAMKKFTGGRSFERDARTRDQIVSELRAAGFTDVAPLASYDVATAWELPHADRRSNMVLFTASARATRA